MTPAPVNEPVPLSVKRCPKVGDPLLPIGDRFLSHVETSGTVDDVLEDKNATYYLHGNWFKIENKTSL